MIGGSRGARVTRFWAGGSVLAVVSYPGPTTALDGLSPAERSLLPGLLRGRTAAALARERGRSLATIRHQVEAIYEKLDVHSRAELVAACANGASRSNGTKRRGRHG